MNYKIIKSKDFMTQKCIYKQFFYLNVKETSEIIKFVIFLYILTLF